MKRSPKRTRLFNFSKSIDAVGKEDRLNALRKLAVENLEERQLLSASTLAEAAAINDLASDTAIVARQDAFQPIDVSNAVGDETPSLVVTTESDVVDPTDGLISLREAVAYAKADSTLGDTITFASNVESIALTYGDGWSSNEIIVDYDVNIGDENTRVTISNENFGVFRVSGAVNATFNGVSIGRDTEDLEPSWGGGAFLVESGANVVVNNATFTGNNGGEGGAIQVDNANLTVNRSKFIHRSRRTATRSMFRTESSRSTIRSLPRMRATPARSSDATRTCACTTLPLRITKQAVSISKAVTTSQCTTASS